MDVFVYSDSHLKIETFAIMFWLLRLMCDASHGWIRNSQTKESWEMNNGEKDQSKPHAKVKRNKFVFCESDLWRLIWILNWRGYEDVL